MANYIVKSQDKKNLKAVCSVIPSKPTLPILGNALLQNNGTIEITASNLEVWVRCEVSTMEMVDKGNYIIPKASAKELGKVKFNNLITYDNLVDEFLEFPEMDILETIEINSKTLITALKKGLRYLSKDRAWSNGIAFNGKRVCATDGMRMYFIDIDTQQFKSDDMLLIPADSVKLLAKIAWDGIIEVSRSKDAISFSDSKTTVICYLIDYNFPDYERVIPDYQPINEVSINQDTSKQLINEIKTIKSLFKNEIRLREIIIVTLNPDNLSIAVDKNGNGKYEYEITFPVKTNIYESVKVGLNWNYLLDAIETFKDQGFTIRFTDYGITELSPVLLYPDNSTKVKTRGAIHQSELSVLMPVRIKE